MDITDWLEIFGWFVALIVVTSSFYRSGVKAGIKHALMTLNLNQHQIEELNKELKKNSLEVKYN